MTFKVSIMFASNFLHLTSCLWKFKKMSNYLKGERLNAMTFMIWSQMVTSWSQNLWSQTSLTIKTTSYNFNQPNNCRILTWREKDWFWNWTEYRDQEVPKMISKSQVWRMRCLTQTKHGHLLKKRLQLLKRQLQNPGPQCCCSFFLQKIRPIRLIKNY